MRQAVQGLRALTPRIGQFKLLQSAFLLLPYFVGVQLHSSLCLGSHVEQASKTRIKQRDQWSTSFRLFSDLSGVVIFQCHGASFAEEY